MRSCLAAGRGRDIRHGKTPSCRLPPMLMFDPHQPRFPRPGGEYGQGHHAAPSWTSNPDLWFFGLPFQGRSGDAGPASASTRLWQMVGFFFWSGAAAKGRAGPLGTWGIEVFRSGAGRTVRKIVYNIDIKAA